MSVQLATLNAQTAAGTTTADAFIVPSKVGYVQFSTVASGAGARLTLPFNGQVITVRNDGANPLSLYPNTGSAIDSFAANAPQVIQPLASCTLVSKDGWKWSVTSYSASAGANGFGAPNVFIAPLNATAVLTSSSPQLITIGTLTGNSGVTLPAPAAGLMFKAKFAVTETKTFTFSATGAIMSGLGIQASGTAANNVGVPVASKTNLVFTNALIGDSFTAECLDGATWSVVAMSSGITISVS